MPELDEWRSAISKVQRGHVEIRGVDLGRLITESSFAEVVSLLFRGQLPSREETRMVDAILVALCDHGVHAPSTLATRIAASSGTPLQASVAAGVAAVGAHHGGALGGAMELLSQALSVPGDAGSRAREVVAEALRKGHRLPGFGHPYHHPDPRGVSLRSLADELHIAGQACTMLDELSQELRKQSGRELLPNVDGAAAAILVDLQFDSAYGQGFFILARVAGLIAHAIEEETRERPVRMIDPSRVTYDGPSLGNSGQ